MFGVGFTEILVIAVVAVVFVGPKRLPEVMRQLGRFFVHARRMSNDVRSTFETVIHQAEQEIHLENLKKIKDLTNGTLVSSLLGEQASHTPRADDHQHHGEKPIAPVSEAAAGVPGTQSVVPPKAESHPAGERSDFDNHEKV